MGEMRTKGVQGRPSGECLPALPTHKEDRKAASLADMPVQKLTRLWALQLNMFCCHTPRKR